MATKAFYCANFYRNIFIIKGQTKLLLNVLVMSSHNPQLQESEIIRLSGGPKNPGDDEDSVHDTGVATTTVKPKLQQPPLYKVVLINDDYTPMDFVVDVLRSFFNLNVEKATQIMLKVHTEGKGVCGVFSKDVAETKSAQVNDYSRECEQPLLCSVEVDR